MPLTEWMQVDPMTLVMALVAVLGFLFVLYLILERDPASAAEKTSRKATGAVMGAGTTGLAAAAGGVDLIAEVPGIVITMLGIGSIVAGFSWEAFAAMALMTYIVSAAITGAY